MEDTLGTEAQDMDTNGREARGVHPGRVVKRREAMLNEYANWSALSTPARPAEVQAFNIVLRSPLDARTYRWYPRRRRQYALMRSITLLTLPLPGPTSCGSDPADSRQRPKYYLAILTRRPHPLAPGRMTSRTWLAGRCWHHIPHKMWHHVPSDTTRSSVTG
jgi:hypothetical protein